jgi:pyridoxine/pyridoxamine 5'-phosphate oxidase
MTSEGFSHLRIEYGDEPLRRADAPVDPFELLRTWLAAAAAAGVSEPNGMTLATVDPDGQPHCRVVLLKELDARGLTFFTNKQSDKGVQLLVEPRAAVNFWWPAPRNRRCACSARSRTSPTRPPTPTSRVGRCGLASAARSRRRVAWSKIAPSSNGSPMR